MGPERNGLRGQLIIGPSRWGSFLPRALRRQGITANEAREMGQALNGTICSLLRLIYFFRHK